MQLTKKDIGKWFVYMGQDEQSPDLAKIIGEFSNGFVIGLSDTVNECWCAGLVDVDGKERGPYGGRLIRAATEEEIENDYCCGDR